MSDVAKPKGPGLMFWPLLPVRLFSHGMRFIFGHPVAFALGFALVTPLFFYLGNLPGPVEANGRFVVGAGSPIYGAPVIGGVCGMMVGLLLIWLSEHHGQANQAWSHAPSLWRPAKVGVIDDD